MKKGLMMVLFAGICVMVSGCASEQPCCPGGQYAAVDAATPPPEEPWYAQPSHGGTRVWYRFNHRMWNDGYSFSHDPQDHDAVAVTMGLDPRFPPAPQPYKAVN